MSEIKKIVLAYSGGLDTSVILHWLKQKYQSKVIACTVEVGQGEKESVLRRNAYNSGADGFYFVDAQKEFVRDYIFRAVKANAIYEGRYLMGTSLARPLIAQKLVEVAKKENADAVAHGATGKGNDQVRFDISFMVLMPGIKIIVPWREWNIKSREEEIAYAKKHKIPVLISPKKPYSMDQNLAHISYEGGVLEEPDNSPTDDMFKLTVSPEKAPNKSEIIKIDFERGNPIAVNGKRYDEVTLMQKLNEIAGRNAVGRVDLVENRLVGMKSRGVYESPGLTLLHIAHHELESLVLDRDTAHYKEMVSLRYAELIYNGLWFSPLKQAFDAFIEVTQRNVTGTVRLKLYKGNCIVLGRKSPYSLYWQELATFEKDMVYNQKDAEGFIRLFGLPLKVAAQKKLLKL